MSSQRNNLCRSPRCSSPNKKCTFREFPANRENNREFVARHQTDTRKCFKFIGLAARSRQPIAKQGILNGRKWNDRGAQSDDGRDHTERASHHRRSSVVRIASHRPATSFRGGFTGRRADVIIVDDPHDISDELEEIESTIKCFNTVLLSRLNNRKNGRMLVVAHRVHEHDLSAHLLQKKKWKHVLARSHCRMTDC
jgi:hypothetical protein